MGPVQYMERMLAEGYARTYGTRPKLTYRSPLEPNDHPEIDDTPLPEVNGIKQYQSMIGALQWCVTLGRIDIHHSAVTTMSSFNAAPRQGHLERVKRMYRYLYKMRYGYKNRVRTKQPDYSNVPRLNYEWSHSIYYNATEEKPKDAPTPKGIAVTHTAYFDANLYHNVITGKALTGIVHFLNQTMIDCYSRKQATVESATFGTEFIAGRTAIQQTKDIRTSLRYLGVPITEPTYMFGDNKSMITNGSVPHSKLGKRHLASSSLPRSTTSGCIRHGRTNACGRRAQRCRHT